MPSINTSEDDFTAVSGAAMDAAARGDMKAAHALDKIARKINAALSANCSGAKLARIMGARGKPLTWQDVPSVLESVHELAKRAGIRVTEPKRKRGR